MIVDETNDEFGFMGLTESSKRGRHKNIPLSQNPKEYDKKSAFKETLKDYKLSENDISKIMKYIEKHKKKK